jgi:hypothetical protein
MWPFKRRPEREKIRAAFSHYLTDEFIDDLVNNPRPMPTTPQPAELCFILLQVRDDPLDQAPMRMSRAIDIIARRDGMIWNVLSSITLATFGLPVSEDPEKDRDQRTKSIARLVTELGSDIRLIYGTADGLLANSGSSQRFHYGPVLPDFQRYLDALTKLEFGQAAEIPAT